MRSILKCHRPLLFMFNLDNHTMLIRTATVGLIKLTQPTALFGAEKDLHPMGSLIWESEKNLR